MLENKPFVRQHLTKKADSFTIRLNEYERTLLERSKTIIEQEKDSTALKQLAWIGANVIHDKKMTVFLGILFKNKKNNKRQGIINFD